VDAARIWLPRGLGLAVFVLYAAVSPPGMYWLDSPELSAAAIRLGAPHPTGFPLYCILVKVASLIPFGELSWRVSLLSAACAGLAVFLACRLVIEVGRGDVAALVGAVVTASALTFSTTFFRQGTVPEIYAAGHEPDWRSRW
jgi:4-amino-4-deoxy-L-arabinose transferase-like glycosyltransferase